MILGIALNLAAGVIVADSVMPQDSVRSLTVPPWYQASVSTSAEMFAERLSTWTTHSAGLSYRGRNASHAIEAIVARRFDKTNSALAVEEAVLLGRGAYVSVRAQFAPGATVIARSDISATLYQAVGKRSEVIPSFRVMTFTDGSVRILGIGAGHYLGLWYFGGRSSVAIQRGEQAVTATAHVRRYAADASPNFIDASVSSGREIVVLGLDNTELQRTSSAAVRGQRLVSRNIGIGLGLTYEAIKALPDRRGITLSSFVRW